MYITSTVENASSVNARMDDAFSFCYLGNQGIDCYLVESRVQQLKFVIVGVFNTVFDFAVFNILLNSGAGKIFANTISVSLAMVVSYFLNLRFVFKSQHARQKLLIFLAVTAFSLYVIQNLLIYILATRYQQGVQNLVPDVGLFSPEVMVNNLAKVMATGVSMVFNFVMYQRFVFKDRGLD